jgi:hypothetical protein
LVWIYGAGQLTADHYALGTSHANNMHPWIMYLSASRQNEALRPPSAFYESPAAPGASPGALIEAPLLTLFPLYSVYQRVHQQRVYAGVTREGFRQPLFVPEQGFRFRQTIDLESLTPETRGDADILIWHKKIPEEMFRGMAAAADAWPASLHSPPRYRFREFAVHEFGPTGPTLPRKVRERFEVIYDDEFITVFDLRASPSSGAIYSR